jgi:hypothetical protein
MASPSDRWRFKPGDPVVDPSGNTGTVELSYPRHGDGKQFPIVLVESGPRNGQRQWPEQGGWLPARDYEPRESRFVCECGADYWAPRAMGRCRDCQRHDEDMDAQRSRETGHQAFARLSAARRFTPAPVTENATEEQRASVDRWRVNDDSDSPF